MVAAVHSWLRLCMHQGVMHRMSLTWNHMRSSSWSRQVKLSCSGCGDLINRRSLSHQALVGGITPQCGGGLWTCRRAPRTKRRHSHCRHHLEIRLALCSQRILPTCWRVSITTCLQSTKGVLQRSPACSECRAPATHIHTRTHTHAHTHTHTQTHDHRAEWCCVVCLSSSVWLRARVSL